MFKRLLLQGFRLCIIVLAVMLLREHNFMLKRRTDKPITAIEVQQFLPDTNTLKIDASSREGWFAMDSSGKRIGYALRTSPASDFLIGYCGSTDAMIVLDPDDQVLGFLIRSSGDTTRHVSDVKADEYFMTILNNMTWDQIATLDLQEAEIDGVSGATMTSINTIEAIRHRFQHANKQSSSVTTIRWYSTDWFLLLIILSSVCLTFSKVKRFKKIRFAVHLFIFIYLGLYYANMLSIGLMMGWGSAGIPWHLSTGLALILAVSLVIPWSSRRPLYCTQICPHGLAQQWLGQLPIKKRNISKRWNRILKTIPVILLAYAILIHFLEIPVELAELEGFNAYSFSHAGIASIIIAVLGLIASLFYRQPYCRYGCPTGAILKFVRSHGPADHFQKKDWVALCLIILMWLSYMNSFQLTNWLYR